MSMRDTRAAVCRRMPPKRENAAGETRRQKVRKDTRIRLARTALEPMRQMKARRRVLAQTRKTKLTLAEMMQRMLEAKAHLLRIFRLALISLQKVATFPKRLLGINRQLNG